MRNIVYTTICVFSFFLLFSGCDDGETNTNNVNNINNVNNCNNECTEGSTTCLTATTVGTCIVVDGCLSFAETEICSGTTPNCLTTDAVSACGNTSSCDECVLGETSCLDSDTIGICQEQAGCLVVVESQNCSGDTPVCATSNNAAYCEPDCHDCDATGLGRCNPVSGERETCSYVEECRLWQPNACPDGSVCTQTSGSLVECISGCNQCSIQEVGTRRCVVGTNVVEECRIVESCRVWSAIEDCDDSGKVCNPYHGNVCEDTCSNCTVAGESNCSPDMSTLSRCLDDGNGCLRLTEQDCTSSGLSCNPDAIGGAACATGFCAPNSSKCLNIAQGDYGDLFGYQYLCSDAGIWIAHPSQFQCPNNTICDSTQSFCSCHTCENVGEESCSNPNTTGISYVKSCASLGTLGSHGESCTLNNIVEYCSTSSDGSAGICFTDSTDGPSCKIKCNLIGEGGCNWNATSGNYETMLCQADVHGFKGFIEDQDCGTFNTTFESCVADSSGAHCTDHPCDVGDSKCMQIDSVFYKAYCLDLPTHQTYWAHDPCASVEHSCQLTDDDQAYCVQENYDTCRSATLGSRRCNTFMNGHTGFWPSVEVCTVLDGYYFYLIDDVCSSDSYCEINTKTCVAGSLGNDSVLMHYDPQSDFETSSYNCDFRDLQISENDGYLHITQTFYGNCDLSGVHYIYLYEKPYPDANIAALYLYGGNTYLDKEGRSTIINGFTAVPSSGSTNQVTFEIPISLIPLNLHNQDIWVSAYMDSYDSMPDSTVAYFSWGCTQDTLGDRRCGTSMGYGAAQECQFDIQANRPAWTVVDLCDAAGESCDLATTSCYSGNPNSILPYLDPLGDHESGTYGCDIRDIQVTETLGTLNFNFIFYSACDISSGTNDLYLMDTHQADRVVLSLYSGTLSVYYYDSGTSAWSLEPVLPTSFTATPSTGITSSISFHIAVSDIPHLDLSPSMFFVYLGVGPSVGVYTDIANDEYYSIFSW